MTKEEEKDQEILLEKVKSAAKTEVEQHLKAYNDEGKKALDAIIEKKMAIFKDVPVEKLKGVVDEMEQINKAIADLKAKKAATKTFVGKKASFLEKKLKEVWPEMSKHLYNNQRVGAGFTIRLDDVDGEKTITTPQGQKINSTSFGAGVIRGFREAGISFEALPELFILDLIQTMSGGPGSNPLSWIERNVAAVGGAGANTVTALNPTSVAEEATKPQLGLTWVEASVVSRTIAAIYPVTKQAVFNYPQLESEIRFELIRRLGMILQQQIINGDGTSNTLLGINSYAKAFGAASFAAAVNNANEFDVLVAAATQIILNGFVPNFALVNPATHGAMNMTKTTDGVYIMPPFSSQSGLNVYGMKVIGTRDITGDAFLVGDSSKSLFNWVEGITIEVGMINDDFQKNIWRIRGELQGMHRIKSHEAFAFVKGDFSVAKGLLETA